MATTRQHASQSHSYATPHAPYNAHNGRIPGERRMFREGDRGGVAMSDSLLTFFLARGDRPPEVTVPMPGSGSSRRGWLVASYAGAAAFFALEAVAREPGEASDLAATDSDQGTTGQIVAAYGLAAGLSPVLRRLRAGRLPPAAGPAGVAVMAAGLALRAWSMRTLGAYYSRTLRTTSDQTVVEYGPYRVIRHPGYLGSIMVWTGFAVTSGNAAAAAGVAALMGNAYSRRIASEEAMLTGRLGSAYAEYSRRTKRLIPFIW